MQRHRSLLTLLAATVLLAGSAFAADDKVPPTDGKRLSEIIKTVEHERLGYITWVEFDDKTWNFLIFGDGKKTTLHCDPHTAVISDKKSKDSDQTDNLPPAGGKRLSELMDGFESRRMGVVTNIEFKKGNWEFHVKKDGSESTVLIDPKTGNSVEKK